MTILAKSTKDYEFIYMPSTAHKVSRASADKIMRALNAARYNLSGEREIWHRYEISVYDTRAFCFAETQEFRIRKGKITEHKH